MGFARAASRLRKQIIAPEMGGLWRWPSDGVAARGLMNGGTTAVRQGGGIAPKARTSPKAIAKPDHRGLASRSYHLDWFQMA